MRTKILGLLALGLLGGSTAQARFVYEIEAICAERGHYEMQTGDLIEALPHCPGSVIGRVVMPEAYVPGTVAIWSTVNDRLTPLEFTIFGDQWDRCLPGACVDRGDILLPILEGPGRVHMRADPGHLEVDESAWHHTYEYSLGMGTYYWAEGTAMIFRQVPVPEPGTLALLGLGLAGVGLSRRRPAS